MADLVQPTSKNLLFSFDQSTKNTGYAFFEGNHLIKSGVFSPGDKDYLIRIVALKKWLITLFSNAISQNYKINVAIEDIQLQEKEPNRGKYNRDLGVVTFKKLAHVQGVILAILTELKIPYTIVSPSSWKKSCNITAKIRDEQKEQAQSFVQANINKEVSSDEADAICIGYHCIKNKIF